MKKLFLTICMLSMSLSLASDQQDQKQSYDQKQQDATE